MKAALPCTKNLHPGKIEVDIGRSGDKEAQ